MPLFNPPPTLIEIKQRVEKIRKSQKKTLENAYNRFHKCRDSQFTSDNIKQNATMLKHFKAKLDNKTKISGVLHEFISQQNIGGGILSEPSKLNQNLKN